MSEQIQVKELDDLMKQLMEAKLEYEKAAQLKAAAFEIFEGLQNKITAVLKDLKRKSYKSSLGGVTLRHTYKVKVPTSAEDKALFFDYLKQKGIEMQYMTVHSQSLNSLYKTDFQEALEQGKGMEFKIPGIGEPTLYESLAISVDRTEMNKERT